MIELKIPDFGNMQLRYLVMDYNGTLAVDGVFLPGVGDKLVELSRKLTLYILTADTFGKVKAETQGLPLKVTITPKNDQAQAKKVFISKLGAEQTVAIGNGRNDRLMLKAARLGLACIQTEGAAGLTLQAADVITTGINEALDLLLNPLRLKATLRG